LRTASITCVRCYRRIRMCISRRTHGSWRRTLCSFKRSTSSGKTFIRWGSKLSIRAWAAGCSRLTRRAGPLIGRWVEPWGGMT
jgi:hypothetical protein